MQIHQQKHQINAYVDEELFNKFIWICKTEERSPANCAKLAIKHFVDWFEIEYKKRGVKVFQ